ncbi:MAG: hypothetical protein K0Q86_438 [Arthrobacter koreensis]|nr:hypothetical protein [Arthrobacter koreensis]
MTGWRKPASLAQLVERLTRNEKVASSILAGGSTFEAPGTSSGSGGFSAVSAIHFPGAVITFFRKALRTHSRTAQAAGYFLHIFFGVCILTFVKDPVAGIIAVMPIVFGLIGLIRMLRRALTDRRNSVQSGR